MSNYYFIMIKLIVLLHPNSRWRGPARQLQPGQLTKATALLIKIFGLDCSELSINKHTQEVSINKPVTILPSKSLAWAVCPVFQDGCVDAAKHRIPLFTGEFCNKTKYRVHSSCQFDSLKKVSEEVIENQTSLTKQRRRTG